MTTSTGLLDTQIGWYPTVAMAERPLYSDRWLGISPSALATLISIIL
ncbi:MAG TPA: hypothetical protein VK203_07390 [Nostocaceae cyanobacterium]|nr:hypothetical protein [Nostocaceae cyanobacterium]